MDMRLLLLFALLITATKTQHDIGKDTAWNASSTILPWELYLQLGEVDRPFGFQLNTSSIAHRHFAIGHLCLHSFMYDAARDAFDMALTLEPSFIEAHIGKILG
jgi:hypothetical protein